MNDEPISISDFRLGKRYSSEDMYRDHPDLHLGDRYTIKYPSGLEFHDTVHSIRYSSAQPEIRQHPTGWRRILRNLTPHRWRKPLPIVRPYQPATTEVIGKSEIARRATRKTEEIAAAINRTLGSG